MLNKQFRKHGYVFTLIAEGKRHLLYQQKDGVSTAYEIHKIRFRPKRTICGKVVNPCLWLPSDEDFGNWAWSSSDYDRALASFAKLESHKAKLAVKKMSIKLNPALGYGRDTRGAQRSTMRRTTIIRSDCK